MDSDLSREIYRYAFWITYRKGNHELQAHLADIMSLVVSDDGRYLFTGSQDSSLAMWDLKLTDKLFRHWIPDGEIVMSLAYYSGVLLCGTSIGIYIYDTHVQHRRHSMKYMTENSSSMDVILSLSFNYNGRYFVSGSGDSMIRLWSVKDGKCLRVYTHHSSHVMSVHIISNLIISTSTDKTIQVCNPSNRKLIRCLKLAHSDYPCGLSFNCDHSMMACIYQGGFIIYSWPKLNKIHEYNGGVLAGSFHPFLSNVFAADEIMEQRLKIYDLNNKTGEECCILHSLDIKNQMMNEIKWTPDGQRLITVSDYQNVFVWEIPPLV